MLTEEFLIIILNYYLATYFIGCVTLILTNNSLMEVHEVLTCGASIPSPVPIVSKPSTAQPSEVPPAELVVPSTELEAPSTAVED